MKKILLFSLVAFFLATNAWALVETAENGPQHITSCYITGAGPVVSGDVVILQTTSPSYIGKEVTGSVVAGLAIYGVVVDGRQYTSEEIADGQWVRVQTYGYCSIVKMRQGFAVTAATAGARLVTSGAVWKAVPIETYEHENPSSGTGITVTGNTVALETKASEDGEGGDSDTVEAWLSW